MFKKKNSCQITPNLRMRNRVKQNVLFLGIFLWVSYFFSISLNFWIRYYTWLESSGNEDSNATFPKSLGGTSKRTDFCDGRGREV